MKSPKKPARKKTAAAVLVPQSQEAVMADIRLIGDLRREFVRRETALNDQIAALTAQVAPDIEALKARLLGLEEGVQVWCEANRLKLTENGKVKTANLTTGEIKWRANPPSVRITGVDDVIGMLRRMGLHQFLRDKTEINKEAILATPDEVKGIAGISIKSGVETFEIVPFEQTITQ
ncbi:host-nuclease inhibitor protein Gam [Salmonella enterica subsp. enterica serovar Yaba]|nr:host-nuclease inhibitor protein Gam [Salmonella enterica subsp. enterica serovar Yaba]